MNRTALAGVLYCFAAAVSAQGISTSSLQPAGCGQGSLDPACHVKPGAGLAVNPDGSITFSQPLLTAVTNTANGHTTQTDHTGTVTDRGIANRPGNISYVNATPGGTYIVTSGVQLVRFLGPGTTATQMVQLPASPQDGDQVVVSTGVGLTITALNAQDAAASAIASAVMLRPLTQLVLLYDASVPGWTVRLMPATLYNDTAAVSAIKAAGFALTVNGISAGASNNITLPLTTGPAGPQGAAGAQGMPGVVPFYGSSGLISGAKCVQGIATTIAGGVWSMSFNSPTFPGFGGFTTPPNVQVQAVSTSNALAGLLFATSQAPTISGVTGTVSLAGVGGLGGAGSSVQVRACGG